MLTSRLLKSFNYHNLVYTGYNEYNNNKNIGGLTMYPSPIGHYSFSLIKGLSENNARSLALEIENSNTDDNDFYIDRNKEFPDSYRIIYKNWKGLTWSVWYKTVKRFIDEYDDPLRYRSPLTPAYLREEKIKIEYYKNFRIEAYIYPEVFIDAKNTMSENNHIPILFEEKFNQEAKRISEILGNLSSFIFQKGKYYVDFDLAKLKIPCSSDQMLDLLDLGYIPFFYKTYYKYNEEYCRNHPSPIDSLINVCRTIDISFNKKNSYAKNINDNEESKIKKEIRFTVQCEYRSEYSISQYLMDNSPDICHDILCDFFTRSIMYGDYYTYERVRSIIKNCNYNIKKENSIMCVLNTMQHYESIPWALAFVDDKKTPDFFESLRELADHGINPVIIPDKYNIKFIQNLLDALINGPRS
jgi:hypothetical protein